MDENVIIRKRESFLSLAFWIKLLFTAGLYFFWWLAKSLTVTDRRVIWSKGLLAKEERTVPLPQVQDVSVSNKGLGFLLGHGTIRIETAGGPGTEIKVDFINRPGQIRDAIMRNV